MSKTKFISIRIDEDLYNMYKSLVDKNMLNSAAVVRSLIQNWVVETTLK